MKTTIKILLVSCLTAWGNGAFAQEESDSTGLAGDNFDLQGAMELFKQSDDLEAFEKSLNTESNEVNNLDLNGDNAIDYIQVIDRVDGKNHAIVLQIAVSESEMQDVAAIAIEQTDDSTAYLQIIGNETLYGEELMMEPYDEVSEKATKGPSSLYGPMRVVIVNVWGWRPVRHIYRPAYVPYVSPWRWRVYPVWWKPWRPVYWHVHRARVRRYHVMYHVTPVCHVTHAHAMYVKNKSVSKTVTVKYAGPQANYKKQQATKSAGNKSAGGTNEKQQSKAGDSKSETKSAKSEGAKQQGGASEKSKASSPNKTKGTDRGKGGGAQQRGNAGSKGGRKK
ncbi:MAG: hypothetical protein QE487_13820 [Fluviicola sp.]|nr:hypothetical protein [Fluviicola sp.]